MTFVGILKEKACFDNYFLILSILTFSFAFIGMVNVASAVSNSTNIAISHIVTTGKGIKVGGIPYAVSINPNADIVYVADKFSKRISFIDGSTGNVIIKVNLAGDNKNIVAAKEAVLPSYIGVSPSMAFNNDTNLLYVAYTDSDSIWVLDGTTGDIVSRPIGVHGIPRSIAADPLTQNVYVDQYCLSGDTHS